MTLPQCHLMTLAFCMLNIIFSLDTKSQSYHPNSGLGCLWIQYGYHIHVEERYKDLAMDECAHACLGVQVNGPLCTSVLGDYKFDQSLVNATKLAWSLNATISWYLKHIAYLWEEKAFRENFVGGIEWDVGGVCGMLQLCFVVLINRVSNLWRLRHSTKHHKNKYSISVCIICQEFNFYCCDTTRQLRIVAHSFLAFWEGGRTLDMSFNGGDIFCYEFHIAFI